MTDDTPKHPRKGTYNYIEGISEDASVTQADTIGEDGEQSESDDGPVINRAVGVSDRATVIQARDIHGDLRL